MDNTRCIRRLKKYLHMIPRAQVDGRSVYCYLNDKNRLALQSMIQRKKSKIISYQELASMSKVFDIELSNEEKRCFLGKNKRHFRRKKQKMRQEHILISKEGQARIDDFFGRFLHSDVLIKISCCSFYSRYTTTFKTGV